MTKQNTRCVCQGHEIEVWWDPDEFPLARWTAKIYTNLESPIGGSWVHTSNGATKQRALNKAVRYVKRRVKRIKRHEREERRTWLYR